MGNKKFIVRLSNNERKELLALCKKGRLAVRKIKHIQVLLRTDSGEYGDSWSDEKIANSLDVSTQTICRIRQAFVEEGLEAALNRKKHENHKPRKLGGEDEAHLIAMCCSKAPNGASRWSLRLLANRLVELKVVERISHEAVRQTLKKMNLNLG